MKRFNHAFTIAFSVETENEGDKVTKEELMKGLRLKMEEIVKEDNMTECCGLPYDTYEVEAPKKKKFFMKRAYWTTYETEVEATNAVEAWEIFDETSTCGMREEWQGEVNDGSFPDVCKEIIN